MRVLTKQEREMQKEAAERVQPFVEEIVGGKFVEPPRIQTSPLRALSTMMFGVFCQGPTYISKWLTLSTALFKEVSIQYPETNSMWINSEPQHLDSVIAHEMTHILDYYIAQHHLLKLAAAGGRKLVSVRYEEIFEFVALRCLAEGRASLLQYLYARKESKNALEEILTAAEREMREYKEKAKIAPVDSLLHVVAWAGLSVPLVGSLLFLSTQLNPIMLSLAACSLSLLYLFATLMRYNKKNLKLLFDPRYRLAFLDPYTPGLYFMGSIAKELSVKEAYRITMEKPPKNLEEILDPGLYLSRVGQSSQM